MSISASGPEPDPSQLWRDPAAKSVDGSPPMPTRRALLRGAAVAGLGLPFLAACGSNEPAVGSTADSSTPKPAQSSTTGSGSSSGALASTKEVPKGGGLILADDGVVITQPKPGTFEGFSSICTHAGCPLDNVSQGTINCICHGSQFSIEDGSVVTGPASAPLPNKPLVVKGSDITLG